MHDLLQIDWSLQWLKERSLHANTITFKVAREWHFQGQTFQRYGILQCVIRVKQDYDYSSLKVHKLIYAN